MLSEGRQGNSISELGVTSIKSWMMPAYNPLMDKQGIKNPQLRGFKNIRESTWTLTWRRGSESNESPRLCRPRIRLIETNSYINFRFATTAEMAPILCGFPRHGETNVLTPSNAIRLLS
jgi:hypothetical protein